MSAQGDLQRPHELPLSLKLLELLTGFWVSAAISVAAKLGIADLLKDGPKRCDDLARAVGAHAPTLYRVMRALASVGVFAEVADRRFGLTPLAESLRADVPGSLRALAVMFGEDPYRAAWDDLLHSVKTGETAFEHVYKMGRFQYLAHNPRTAEVFNAAMTAFATQVYAPVVSAYDFSGFGGIVDVGGGHGTLITLILKANPKLRGVLFDTAAVVEGAKKRIEAAGLAGRCEIVAGDFFASVPSGGGAYVLSHVIHDWDDDRSIAILKNCRSAMAKNGKLLLVEQVILSGNEGSLGKLMDINMLVMTGGRERTEAEYRALYAAAGFKLTRTIPTASLMSVIEGVPA